MGLLIHVTEVSLFLDVGLETQGDQVGGKHSVEELQGLPQRLLGEHHLAHVETDLWGRDEQRFRSQVACASDPYSWESYPKKVICGPGTKPPLCLARQQGSPGCTGEDA